MALTMRIPVHLDYLMANQLIAAADTREKVLAAHAQSIKDAGGEIPEELNRAIVDTIAAEFALRAAFDTMRDDLGEAPEMYGDVPLALHIYQAEGR